MYESLVCGGGPSEDLLWQPDERVAESVIFILNNLQQSNVIEKANELRMNVEFNSYFCRWFARHLLVARISTQSNYMSTYYHLLMALKSPELEKQMRDETFRQIRRLLTKTVSKTPADRDALKQMGTWLGFLTFARNKPLSYRDLNLGEILKVAQELGNEELAYVVPFITKMLRASRMSSICGPESAYTKSLLNLLIDLHEVDNLKMNIKFEIEVLFRDLGISLDSTKGCEATLLFAKVLGVPVVAAERILAVHNIPAEIPDPIAGVDEDLIMRLNGYIFEIPSVEVIREILASLAQQQHRLVPSQVQHMNQRMNAHAQPFAVGGMHSLSPPNSPEIIDPTQVSHCVEMLFRNLHTNYYTKAGLANHENGVAFIFDQLNIKRFLFSKSAVHFLSVTVRGAVHICYDMDKTNILVARRDFCIYLLDNVALLIVMAMDHYSEPEMKVHCFRLMLSAIVDIIGTDIKAVGYRNFSAFPYFRVLLSIMWNVMKKYGGNPDLLCRLQLLFYSAMSALEPSKMGVCAFEWLNVIGESDVAMGFVQNPAHKYRARESYVQLISFALKFLDGFYSQGLITEAVQKFCTGLTRLVCFLSVNTDLIHEYYHVLSNAVPPVCSQLRNIVSSSAPANSAIRPPAPGRRWLAPEPSKMQRAAIGSEKFS